MRKPDITILRLQTEGSRLTGGKAMGYYALKLRGSRYPPNFRKQQGEGRADLRLWGTPRGYLCGHRSRKALGKKRKRGYCRIIAYQILIVVRQSNFMTRIMNQRTWLWDLLLWALWLAWAGLWFNRGFYLLDHGREALVSYLWLEGFPPWSVNEFFSSHWLGWCSFYFASLIKAFGFTPIYWRFYLCLIIYGALCWLVYRLLARLLPRGRRVDRYRAHHVFFSPTYTQWVISIIFWNGALLALISAFGFRSCFAPSPVVSQSWPWLLLSAGAAVASVMTMSLAGYATFCAIGGVLALKFLLDQGNRQSTLFYRPALGTIFSVVYWFSAGIHAVSRLGFPATWHQLSNYPRQLNYYGNQSFANTMSDWWLIFYYSGVSSAPWSLLAIGGFGLGICFLARTNPAKLPWFRTYLAVLYWATVIGIAGWLLFDFHSCLEFFHKWFRLVYLAPPLNFIFSLIIGSILLFDYCRKPANHQDMWHWLLLLALGGALFMAFTLSHRGKEHAIYSSIVFMPVVWAYVWHRFPIHFHFAWPSGLAAVLVLVMVLLGVSHRVFEADRQASWFEPAPYHHFTGLRGMRGNDAPEQDLVLSLAQQVIKRGGKILVYPSHATIYPLVSTLPPMPFPDLSPPEAMYTYPRDPKEWRSALDRVDNPPPDLVIFETNFSTQRSWLKWKEMPYVPKVAVEVGDDFWNYDPSLRYHRLWRGKRYALYLRNGQTLDLPKGLTHNTAR